MNNQLNGMIDWQAYYNLNRHKPLNKILAEYNYILQEFNQHLQEVAMAQTAQPALASTPAAVAASMNSGGGPAGNFINMSLNEETQALINVPYTASILTKGTFTGPVAFSIIKGSLPSGLTLNPTTGKITGIPDDIDTFTFTVLAKAQYGDEDYKQFTITVTTEGITLTVYSPEGFNTSGSIEEDDWKFEASGGEPPYTFSIVSGSLPDGAFLSPRSDNVSIVSDFLSGEGQFTFKLKAQDNEGNFVINEFSGEVYADISIDIVTGSFISGSTIEESDGNFVYAVGGVSPYTYSISSGSLPTGLLLNSETGYITGLLETEGTSNFDISVIDNGGYTKTSSFEIIVSPIE